jgi:hypothetical protein
MRHAFSLLLLPLLSACSSSGGSASSTHTDASTGSDAATDAEAAPDVATHDANDEPSPEARAPDAGWACTPSPVPPTGDPITGLTLGDGWTDPRALPGPVDTSGWEDSSIISADGTRLYFAYTQYDYAALQNGQLVVTGPTRPGEPGPQFNIYEATFAAGDAGAWVVTPSTVNSDDASVSSASEGVTDPQSTMVFVRYVGSSIDIYMTRQTGGVWSAPEALPAPINTPCVEDNAAISGDGTILYFDSNRADPLGTSCNANQSSTGRTIYRSTLVAGTWTTPVPVPGAPNGGDWHWQGYSRDPSDFYWAGHDTSCGAASDCVYHARLQPDGGYGATTIVLTPVAVSSASEGDAVAVGEASVTCDGHYLYFIYIQTNDAGGNLNVGVAHKP